MIRFISEMSHEDFFKKFDVKYHGYGFSYMDGLYRTNVIDKEYMVNCLYICRPEGMTKKMIREHLQNIKRNHK